jgi:hypothetical protein
LVVLAVNRLAVVEMEMGQVQRGFVDEVPQPGLQNISRASTSRFKAFAFVSGFWFISYSFRDPGALVLPLF